MKNLFRTLFFFLTISFTSCSEPPVELKENFSFRSTIKPGTNAIETVVQGINNALKAEATKAGRDSLLQIKEEKTSLPTYQDIAFFPVLDAAGLEELSNKGFGRYIKNEHSAQINQIDFQKNFVFIIGHPAPDLYNSMSTQSAGPAIYVDALYEVERENGKIKLKMESESLGAGATGLSALMQGWESKVYVIERKDCDSLFVELYEDTYPFSLVKK